MIEWFRTLRRSTQAPLIVLSLAILTGGGILFLSAQKFLADTSCGCGPPPPEATGEFEKTKEVAIFNNRPVDYSLAELIPSPEAIEAQKGTVLGVATDERWIEIDLSEQKLYAHEGKRIVYEFLISSGKWAPTPIGEFRVWVKLRYTKMSGGSRARGTYYYLPNVPYVMYFYKGYGIHGTYWHNNFGHPMSHGCINMAIPDAEKIFYWSSPVISPGENVVYPSKDNPGIRVVIHD